MMIEKMKRNNIKWIAPEETIDSGKSTFVDDYFAHEDYYEKDIIDSSYLGNKKLKSQVKVIFGDEKLF